MIVEKKEIKLGTYYWVAYGTGVHRMRAIAADETRVVMATGFSGAWAHEAIAPRDIIAEAEAPSSPMSWWKRLFGGPR